MRQVAPLLALCAFPHCLMLAFEGVIVVSRDLSFLSFVYMILGPVFIAYQVCVIIVAYIVSIDRINILYCL